MASWSYDFYLKKSLPLSNNGHENSLQENKTRIKQEQRHKRMENDNNKPIIINKKEPGSGQQQEIQKQKQHRE